MWKIIPRIRISVPHMAGFNIPATLKLFNIVEWNLNSQKFPEVGEQNAGLSIDFMQPYVQTQHCNQFPPQVLFLWNFPLEADFIRVASQALT